MKNDLNKYKILVVDDEPIILRMIKNILSPQGYDVTECTNGKDALKIASETKPDVVIMDYNMPKMSGPEIIKAMRQIDGLKYIKVIMLTANNDSGSVQKSLEAGISGYLLKPISIHSLLTKISSILN